MPDAFASLWRATAAETASFPPLAGRASARVAVIGGGYTGCSAALHLAAKGIETILVEADDIGWGCSGRNVGMVNAGLFLNPDVVEGALGEKAGRALNEGLGGSPALVRSLIEAHGIACDASTTGIVKAAFGEKAAAGLAEQVRQWQRDAGLPVTGIVGPDQIVVAAGPVHIAAHSAGVGEILSANASERGALLDYSSTQKLVTVPLSVGDYALAAVGRPVTLTLPDDSEVEGAISELGSVVTDGAIAVTITVADQVALGGLEVASVDVEFVSEGRDDVLSVPITALLARPEGGFAVELVAEGTSTLVPVDTGLFAAGRVEISAETIAEGMLVGVPR